MAVTRLAVAAAVTFQPLMAVPSVAQHAIELAVVVAVRERTVVVQGSIAYSRLPCRRRANRQQTCGSRAGEPTLARAVIERVGVRLRSGRPRRSRRRRRCTVPCGSRAGRPFGDQEIEVSPALAVRVAALVDQRRSTLVAVGAVIRLKPRGELVALAAVLAGVSGRAPLQQFGRTVDRARGQLLARDHAFVSRVGYAQLAAALAALTSTRGADRRRPRALAAHRMAMVKKIERVMVVE